MLIPGLLISYVFIIGLAIRPWRNQRRAKIFLLISFFALSLVSGFRACNLGADTANYVHLYNDMIWLRVTRFERGSVLFMGHFIH